MPRKQLAQPATTATHGCDADAGRSPAAFGAVERRRNGSFFLTPFFRAQFRTHASHALLLVQNVQLVKNRPHTLRSNEKHGARASTDVHPYVPIAIAGVLFITRPLALSVVCQSGERCQTRTNMCDKTRDTSVGVAQLPKIKM